VFNFPAFNCRRKLQTNRKYNSYFTDLAAATHKFENTSRKYNFNNYAHGKMMKYHLNGDLDLNN